MRLIDADALVEKLKEDKQKLLTLGGLGTSEEGGAYAAMSIAVAEVQDMPDKHFPPASQWISVNERLPELCEQRSYDDGDGETYVLRYSLPVIAHVGQMSTAGLKKMVVFYTMLTAGWRYQNEEEQRK